jgi:hypothetical protein
VCCRPLPRAKIGRKNEIMMRGTMTSIDTLVIKREVHVTEVTKVSFILLTSVVNVALMLESSIKYVMCRLSLLL